MEPNLLHAAPATRAQVLQSLRGRLPGEALHSAGHTCLCQQPSGCSIFNNSNRSPVGDWQNWAPPFPRSESPNPNNTCPNFLFSHTLCSRDTAWSNGVSLSVIGEAGTMLQ